MKAFNLRCYNFLFNKLNLPRTEERMQKVSKFQMPKSVIAHLTTLGLKDYIWRMFCKTKEKGRNLN